MARWIQIEGAVCYKVFGKDARRYLHNRLSNDIRGLHVGASLRAAALTAQGRVEGLFTVHCAGEEEFILVADGGDNRAIAASLRKFVVADRVVVDDLTENLRVVHISGDMSSEQIEPLAGFSGIRARLPSRRLGSTGLDVLVCAEELGLALAWCRKNFGEPLSEEEYYCVRWEATFPVYPSEINQDAILTECGMRDAVSFSKGCYVGQEVLERSDAVGKLPRGLKRVEFAGLVGLAHGNQLMNARGESVGKIVSSMHDSRRARTLAFAMLRSGAVSRRESLQCGVATGVVVE